MMLLQTQLTLKLFFIRSICPDRDATENTIGYTSVLPKKDQNQTPLLGVRSTLLLQEAFPEEKLLARIDLIYVLCMHACLCIYMSYFPKLSTAIELQNQPDRPVKNKMKGISLLISL